MDTPDTTKHADSPVRWLLGILVGALFLPFIYLTSLAVVHSAYAHGHASRAFLRAYAAPSNVMVRTPGVGRVFSTYYQVCVKLTRADYDPNAKR